MKTVATIQKMVDGHVHEITIDSDGGFRAPLPTGEQAHYSTLEALLVRLKRDYRKAKIEHAIRVVLRVGNRYERVTLRGIHLTTGEALITRADGSKDSAGKYNDEILAFDHEISDETIAELNRLEAVARNAQNAYTGAVQAARIAASRAGGRKEARYGGPSARRLIEDGATAAVEAAEALEAKRAEDAAKEAEAA